MIVSRMAKHSQALLALLVVLVVSSLVLGMNVPPASESALPEAPAAEADSSPSVTCIPLGLYGTITAPVVVESLSEGSDNLTFVGTSNGLYVVGPDGKLQHFLYSPFGIRHFTLIDDITDDGIREVVVALNDTQVPALRCYEGATWEKLWQFAPMARIWDRLWVERQLGITGIEVISTGSSQNVVVTSGRCIFSINAEDGTEQWRFSASSALGKMATVADLNDDDTDEVFAGSNDGHLYLLNGKTGEARWRTKLPEHKGANYDAIERLVSDIITLDRELGKVLVTSGDGWAQMFDLGEKRREWDVDLTESDSYQQNLPITLAPDVTDDGLPEIVIVKGSSGYMNSSATTLGMVMLNSDGDTIWEKEMRVWEYLGAEVGSFGGKPVILEPAGQEIRLIDIKDGETVVKTIPISPLDEQAPMVQQVGETSFLLFSSGGDLSMISSSGDTLWNYPRIANVMAKGGSFVGDGTEDVLFWCEYGTQDYTGSSPIVEEKDGVTVVTNNPAYTPQVQAPTVRMLKMMDGATRGIAWSYEVPLTDLKTLGGLKGIQVTPDLAGSDNVQDIIGYREDTVFIFSSKDGTPSSFSVTQPIASLEVIRNGASGNAIAVGTAGGLSIFDSAGNDLWTTTSAEWVEDESGSFMVLDDVNSDNVSDLAVISAAKIVVLKSVAGTATYELHLTSKAETDYSISYAELVPDQNRDGVKDLTYLQGARASQQGGQTPCPLLSQTSPVDGKELFKVNSPLGVMAYDLDCGDFNGDGYADSLFSSYQGNTCEAATSSQGGYSAGKLYLWILSGKDGTTLRVHFLDEENLYGGPPGSELPTTNIGDVDGDGADDLVYNIDSRDSINYTGSHTYTGYEAMQWGLEAYSVVQDSILKSIPATPLFRMGYPREISTDMLQADVDADGHAEVIVGVFEPSIPSYDPDAYRDYDSSSKQYIAVMDIDSGWRMAGFTGFDTTTMSPFETNRPGILGMAACGGACFLRMDADLQVTSPDNGAKTGPTVGVSWEGPTDGDFSQVFVDGVRNDITNGFGADLYLGRGEHGIVVRSVDDYGRISYSPPDLGSPLTIKVTPSPWKPVLLVLTLFFLLAVILLLFYARLHRMWRARRRATK